MKTLLLIFFVTISLIGFGQSADIAFHTAARQYIAEKNSEAKRTLDDAIVKYPQDTRLRNLRAKIKDEEKQQQEKEKQEKADKKKEDQNKNPDDQNSKDQEGQKNKEDQEKKNKKENNENGEKKEDEEQKSKEKDQKSDQDQAVPSSLEQKLEQMNMSEEKANMILDALKNQEVQYLQQNKRKATQSKDSSKPDW